MVVEEEVVGRGQGVEEGREPEELQEEKLYQGISMGLRMYLPK